MSLRIAVAATIFGAALMSSAGQAAAGSLDSGAIRALFPGSFEAKIQGYRLNFAASGNGGLKGEAYGQHDQGHWFLKGSTLCVSWREWTKGKAKCGSISQQGGWLVASSAEGDLLKFRRTVVAQQ